MASASKVVYPIAANTEGVSTRALHPLSVHPLEFAERRLIPWLLVALDVVCIQFAVWVGHAARVAALSFWPAALSAAAYHSVQIASLLVPIGYALAGLYPGYGLAPVERLRKRLKTTALVFGGLLVWDNVVLHGEWSRGILLGSFAAAAALSPALEAASISILIRLRWWGTPVIVLSSEQAGTAVVRALRKLPPLGLNPIALLKPDASTWGTHVHQTPVLGPPSIAGRLAGRATTAVVAMPGLNRAGLARVVEALPYCRVIVVPQLSGLQTLWVTARDLGGTLGLELQNSLLRKRAYYLKRLLDYALGIPLLAISAPVIALLALWIKCVSRGPAFYSQEREGHRGRMIRVWKLRTMFPDADSALERYLAEHEDERQEWERFFKLKHDPRILPGVGRFLRKTSLDELPQLWNVIRGELSLVGPRPFPRYHVEAFDNDFRALRHSVLPGVTGFWQISARSDADIAEQERLDTYYIRNWSPWLDLYILARTVGVVLLGEGAY